MTTDDLKCFGFDVRLNDGALINGQVRAKNLDEAREAAPLRAADICGMDLSHVVKEVEVWECNDN